MRITRKSAISGTEHTRNIPVNPNDYILWESGTVSIMEAMPYLNDEDRDFILSGIVRQEWASAFASA